MPILIWIATIACMLEIGTGRSPGQTQKASPARTEGIRINSDRAGESHVEQADPH
jgi:hypothetical protein